MPDTNTQLKNELSIIIYGPEKVLYEDKIKAFTSVNDAGKFDVLPLHSNFISIIKDYLILHQQSGDDKEFKFRNGVLKVYANQISVFLGLEGLK
jgi:F0F1-type ATP synthase epsilon subunit